MAMRPKGKTTHRSMRGKTIDMDMLRQRNELTPAVGNVRVNARGDELGPGGKILRKREQVLQDYYDKSPKMEDETKVIKEAVGSDAVGQPSKSRVEQIVEQDDWIEDEDGNFIKRGEE